MGFISDLLLQLNQDQNLLPYFQILMLSWIETVINIKNRKERQHFYSLRACFVLFKSILIQTKLFPKVY